MKAPLPPDEAQRLQALRRYDILDTAPEEVFDDLTLLAAQICRMPAAMISLVDDKRQWFKSRLGIEASETSREVAFCAHAILHKDEVMEVRDALADPRFADNTLVTSDPHVRFYAGAPLVGRGGHALGTLCVIDRTPRQLTDEQKTALAILSKHVVAQFELQMRARELKAEVTIRQETEVRLRQQNEELAVSQREKDRLLEMSERVRDTLLSVLEDEKLNIKKLKASEERFRQVVENIHEVFWVVDLMKKEMIYISLAYEKIWGRTCASLYKAPATWLDAIHPEDRPRVAHAVETKQQQGEYDETYRIVRPDGSVRWIRDRAFPVRNEADEVYRVVGTAEDITERMEAERLSLRSQRLEAIGTLASGVAHDLNNALAPILMGVEIIKSKYPAESDIMDMFQNSARRSADMVRQLLSFAKGAEGERVLIQPAQLVKEMQAMMKGSFPKSIQLTVKCDPKLPMIRGDATQLHQVLLNLCVNARDAMPHGSTLTLGAEAQEMDASYASSFPDAKPGKYVLLRVRDTGTGIPPEVIDRIFEPFFTTKAPDKGTGLGLSTVAGIVKGHAGFLRVYSQPGHGSTFNVYLPADYVAADAPVKAHAEVEFHGQGETILVVDDEASVREVARMVLRRLNFTPLTAIDGADGLIQAARHSSEVRAIITDMHMPLMDGLSFVRSVRRMRPELPIAVASGRLDEAVAQELETMGVTTRLDKPFAEAQLAEALKHLLAPK